MEVERLPFPEEAAGALRRLAAGWGDVVDSAAIEAVPMKGAMTNEVFEVRWRRAAAGGAPAGVGERKHRRVVLRVYGEGVEVFFDRGDENRTFEAMSRLGQGPRLLGRFPNGRIEEFIHARTLSAADLRDPQVSALVATKLREFHDLDMSGSKKVLLWDRLSKWLEAAIDLCSPFEAEDFCLNSLEDEIKTLKAELSGKHHRVGFCHNDLQYGNIMMDEETRAVTIIDYEYASFNPIAYDLANHFCEMAADYHTETPHILDYTKYPDFEERKRFVQIYLSTSEEKSDGVEENLLQDIEKYALASHLLWGLWGLISARVNDIDFDYIDYARQRFQQYWLKKASVVDH